MNYTVTIDEFEGPMDLLLHLIKKSDIDIFDISVEEITKQYLAYLDQMEQMDLDVASEYLIMAAELIEIKSSSLLPRNEEVEDEFEEDSRENLIKRLIEYKRYKEVTSYFRNMEEERKKYHTKEVSDLREYAQDNHEVKMGDLTLTDLAEAFNKFLERKELDKPLNTKITKREYSVSDRSNEIKHLLKKKKKLEFSELFEIVTKEYVVVTFLSILDLARKQELKIVQEDNFNKIYLSTEGE